MAEDRSGAQPVHVSSSMTWDRCSTRPEVANLQRIVASLSAVLMLAAVTAMAQEKVKDPPQSGHEGMAKAGGTKSDAAVIAKATSAAPPDIGRNAAVMGMGADGKMKELRAGTNGWMCMLDLAGDSMCLDKAWQAWGDAWMNKTDPPKPQTVGVAYMLKGDKGASNTSDRYRDGARADERDGHRMAAHAVARDAAGGVGGAGPRAPSIVQIWIC
jgi:hypothetical protein